MSTSEVEIYASMMKTEFPKCPLCNCETDFIPSGLFKRQIECVECGARWLISKKYNWKGQDQGLVMQLTKIGKSTVSATVVNLLNKAVPISKWKNLATEEVSLSHSKKDEREPEQHSFDDTFWAQTVIFDESVYWEGDKKVLDSMKGDFLVTQNDVRFIRKGKFMKSNKKLLENVLRGTLKADSNDCKEFLDRIRNPVIYIPMGDIDVESLKYETLVKVERKGVSTSKVLAFGIFGLGGAGGEKRTNYYVLNIPYQDNDGIRQEPKFFVNRKKGKELHGTIYQRALRIKKETEAEKKVEIETRPRTTEKDSEAMRILKLRLAKGEITKEQFEEMKAVIEN